MGRLGMRLPHGNNSFNPVTLPGLLLYLRPESYGGTPTGARLTQWKDESGSGRNFDVYGPSNLVMQGPVVRRDGGLAMLRFLDSGNPYTALASQDAALKTNTFTFFIVAKWNGGGGATQGMVTRERAADGGWNINATTGIMRALCSNAGAFTYETITNAWPIGVKFLVCLECRDSDNRIRTFYNDVLNPTTTHVQSLTATDAPLTLGSFYMSANNAVNGISLPGNFDAGEVMMWNRVLTDIERARVAVSLKTRWRI